MSTIYPSNNIIYKISNVVNNKPYIGKTEDQEYRWYKHKWDAENGCPYAIHAAMRKHGIENFKMEPIFTVFKAEDLSWAEIELIKHWDCCTLDGNNKGYNMTRGGEGCTSEYATARNLRRLENGTSHFLIPHTCPHCGIIVNGIVYFQSHGEKCKLNPEYDTSKRKPRTSSQFWEITYPDDIKIVIQSLYLFCEQNNLDRSSMVKVSKNKLKHYKKYKCEKLSEDNPRVIEYKLLHDIL